WAEPLPEHTSQSNVGTGGAGETGSRTASHPFLHRTTPVLRGHRFESNFTGHEAVLADHVVQGRALLPGVAYLEIARAALCRVHEMSDGASLRNLVWMRPFIADAGIDGAGLAVTLTPRADGWTDCSFSQAAGVAEILCEAQIRPMTLARDFISADLRAIFGRCGREVSVEDVYAGFSGSGVSYGPSFRTLTALRGGIDEALGLLERRSGPRGEELLLDPGVLDGALQAAAGIEGADGRDWQSLSEGRLPFALAEAQLLSPLPDRCWSWVRRVSGSDTLDVDVLDEEGRPCVRLRGLAFRPMRARRVKKQEIEDRQLIRKDAARPPSALAWLILPDRETEET
ncbi:polyketide synthase dehydratase domain-containing protein, partial [Sphingobium yanoikuyae]